MMVLEYLKWANEQLKVDEGPTASPMLDAEVLLAAALGMPKNWLFSNFSYELKKEEEEKFEQFIKRRLNHEPVAYIIGWHEFYGRKFRVNAHTLIPRPATEILIEEVLKITKDLNPAKTLIIDIGTGSGAIAVTLAAEAKIPVIATDISQESLDIALNNAQDHEVDELIDFRLGDTLKPIVRIFTKLQKDEHEIPEHLILCANLPYLTQYQWLSSQPEIANFEPKNALVAGTDGLDAYWQLFRELHQHRDLFPADLTTFIEIDPEQAKRIQSVIRHDFPTSEPIIIPDLQGQSRIVKSEL